MVRKLEFTIAASIDVPLYLFDEPTAALDLATIPAVHELFREKQAAGKTIVVASHRPMTADIADRIAFLADGRIVATGTPAELLASVPPVLETGASNASALTAVVDGEPFAVAGSIHGFVLAIRRRGRRYSGTDTRRTRGHIGDRPNGARDCRTDLHGPLHVLHERSVDTDFRRSPMTRDGRFYPPAFEDAV